MNEPDSKATPGARSNGLTLRSGRRDAFRFLAGAGLTLGAWFGSSGCSGGVPAGRAKTPVVAYVDPDSPDARPDELDAFRDQLGRQGFVPDRNVMLQTYYLAQSEQDIRSLAADVVARNVDVIVTFGTAAARALQAATARTTSGAAPIPIVVTSSSDPVGTGLAQSLEHPGGNITGLTSLAPRLTPKRLQLLTTLLPDLPRVGFLWDSQDPGDQAERDELQRAAYLLRVQLVSLDWSSSSPQGLFGVAVNQGVQGILAFASGKINGQAATLAPLAARHQLPFIYAQREAVTNHDGLMAYGPLYPELYRWAAIYVAKILTGANPADLPILRPQRFNLAVQSGTATQLGLSIPRALRVQVDEVI
jgi:ABC-type uncharacterized transport system substrate-binding protein